MGTAIGDILPLAVGVAVSPVPVIAVILLTVSVMGVLLLVLGVARIGNGTGGLTT